MADIPSVRVVGRLGLTVGDGADPDELPDVLWCDSGSVRFTPLNTYTKVAGGSPVPWTAGHAVIDVPLDSDGYLVWQGARYLWMLDLTSEAVNPTIGSGKATHRIEFRNVKAQDTAVSFPATTVRLAADTTTEITADEAAAYGLTTGDAVCDITLLTPVPAAGGTPITRGPQGVGVESLDVSGNRLVYMLSDGSSGETSDLPITMIDNEAFVVGLTIRQRPASLSSARPDRRDYPLLSKPRETPILTKADQPASGIYWSHLIDLAIGNPAVDPAERWMLTWSTDHADGGMYYATAADPEDTFTSRGLLWTDETAGNSSDETFTWIWNQVTGLWHVYYQVINSGGQQTWLVTVTPDLATWTVVGAVLQKSTTNPNVYHTGYAKVHLRGGEWLAYSLFGRNFASWSSLDGINWRMDPAPLPWGQDLCTSLTGFTEDDNWRLNWTSGDIVDGFGPGPVLLTTAAPYSPGGEVSGVSRVVAVPLTPDLRGFAARPADITPATQPWETTPAAGFGNAVVTDDGRLVTTYRAGGATGGFGIARII